MNACFRFAFSSFCHSFHLPSAPLVRFVIASEAIKAVATEWVCPSSSQGALRGIDEQKLPPYIPDEIFLLGTFLRCVQFLLLCLSSRSMFLCCNNWTSASASIASQVNFNLSVDERTSEENREKAKLKIPSTMRHTTSVNVGGNGGDRISFWNY